MACIAEFFRSLNGAQKRVDKNSLWAVFTSAGLRRVATPPNSAVGIVCEPPPPCEYQHLKLACLSILTPEHISRWVCYYSCVYCLVAHIQAAHTVAAHCSTSHNQFQVEKTYRLYHCPLRDNDRLLGSHNPSGIF